jgi:hypothetical protein
MGKNVEKLFVIVGEAINKKPETKFNPSIPFAAEWVGFSGETAKETILKNAKAILAKSGHGDYVPHKPESWVWREISKIGNYRIKVIPLFARGEKVTFKGGDPTNEFTVSKTTNEGMVVLKEIEGLYFPENLERCAKSLL